MAAPEPLYRLLDIDQPNKIPNMARCLVEAFLISELITELKQHIEPSQTTPSHLLNKEKIKGDDPMLDLQFLRIILRDMITAGDYTLEGIARYTGVHPDLIHDIAGGINTSPSLPLFHRLIELHKIAQPSLYYRIRERIIHRLKNDDTL